MKVAICMSGHMRTYLECLPSLKQHFLDKYDCDLFVSTWQKLGYFDRVVKGLYNSFDAPILNDTMTPELLKEAFGESLRVIQIENSKEAKFKAAFDPKPYRRTAGCIKIHVGHTISMLYKIYAADALRRAYEHQNEVTYDLVVRTRADLKYDKGIEDALNLNPREVYLPSYGHWDGLNDQFAVADSSTMTIWTDCYKNFARYYQAGCPMNGEVLTKFHAKATGLSIIKGQVKFALKRATGEEIYQP